jgi:urea transporter
MPKVKPAVGVIDTLLRGVGQVMLQNKPMTGLLFLVGIFLNSHEYGLTRCSGWSSLPSPPISWVLTRR